MTPITFHKAIIKQSKFKFLLPFQAFFYRNSKRAEDIVCEREDNCDPEPGFGYHCAACRMKKCLELGMSLKGGYSQHNASSLYSNSRLLQVDELGKNIHT